MKELNPTLDVTSTELPCWERFQEAGRTRPLNEETLFKNFCEIVDVFEKYTIRYAISHGSLLGLVRYNGRVIPWDDDLDFTFFIEDMSKIKKAEKELKELGFYVPKRTKNPDDKVVPQEKQFYYDFNALRGGEKVEGWGIEKIGNKWVYDKPRVGLAWESKFFDRLGIIEWKGRIFTCPDFKEEYLERMYGNYPINEANAHRKYSHKEIK